jgi:hypothetical protein
MKFTCESCPWEGDAEDLEVTEEYDHEVWIVYRCPICSEEMGRENKHQLTPVA